MNFLPISSIKNGGITTEKLYCWAEDLEDYISDNDTETKCDKIIEIKRLNFFIGKNNAGKSRFLRAFFKILRGQHLYNSLQFRKIKSFKNKFKSNDIYLNNPNYKNFLASESTLKPENIGSIIQIFEACLSYLSQFNQFQYLYPNKNIQEVKAQFVKEIESEANKFFHNQKFYLPILRGMRPVTDIENKQPYIERAQKDYFSNKNKFNAKNIITGECLYQELKVHLLGEPEQRELIKVYEEKLSQYFFDNEPVTLIPKFGKDEYGNEIDVVHIKMALLHKDLKCKAPLIEPNLRHNLGKWST